MSGFYPVYNLITGAYNGQSRPYRVPSTEATALFRGDAVVSTGTGESDVTYDFDGVATVADYASGGGAIRGFISGIRVDRATPATEHPGYLPASTGGLVHVVDDPFVVFEAQPDDATGVVTDIGEAADIAVGAGGSTTTGVSSMKIDSSDLATGDQLVLLGLSPRTGNDTIGSTDAWYLVKINEHEFMGAGTPV